MINLELTKLNCKCTYHILLILSWHLLLNYIKPILVQKGDLAQLQYNFDLTEGWVRLVNHEFQIV